jgi:hypothetical protein
MMQSLPAGRTTSWLTLALPLESISEHWGHGAVPLGWTLTALGSLALVIAAVAFYRWHRRRHERDRPLAVFYELAAIGRLSFSERYLLWRMARHQALPGPATLLFSPRTLRVHAAAFVDGRWRGKQARVAKRVRRIRQRLAGLA